MQRIEIRNTKCKQKPSPHVMDILVDEIEQDIYLEFKCRSCKQKISLAEIMRQVRASMSNAVDVRHMIWCFFRHSMKTQ